MYVCICICISRRPPIMYHNYLGGAPVEIIMVHYVVVFIGFVTSMFICYIYIYIKHPSRLAKLNQSNMEDEDLVATVLWAHMASSAMRSSWLLLPLTIAPGAKYSVSYSNLQPHPNPEIIRRN